MKLRSHLYLLALGALLPMIALSVAIGYFLVLKERTTLREEAIGRARAVLSAVDSALLGEISAAEALAASAHLERGDFRAFHDEARRMLATHPNWLNVGLLAADGRPLLQARMPFGAELPPASELASILRAVETRRPTLGGMAQEPAIDGPPAVRLRVPVIQGDAVRYVIAIPLKLELFAGILRAQPLSKDAVIALVDDKQRMIARLPEVPPGSPASASFTAALRTAPEGWFAGRTLEGAATYTPYVTSPVSGWALGIALPEAVVDAAGWRTAAALAAGTAAALAIAWVLAILLAQRIEQPISALAAAAADIRSGRNTTIPRSAAITQIADLAAALDDAHVATREREALLRAISESTTDLVYVKDREGRMVYANPATLLEMGVSPEQALASDQRARFSDPQEAEAVIASDRRVIESERSETLEETHTGRDGRRVFLSTKSPLRDARGTIVGVVGVSRDITERKRTERLLQEQNRLLERIAKGAPLEDTLHELCGAVGALTPNARVAILIADERRERFTRFCSDAIPPSFGEHVGTLPVDAIPVGTCGTAVHEGRAVSCSDAGADERRAQPWRELCLAHGVRACHSTPVPGADGRPAASFMLAFAEARAPDDWERRLGEFGAHIASIALERDRAAAALREADRRKDEFLAMLSHELRNPLAPLRNSLELLRRAPGGADLPQRPLEIMGRQVEQLVRLVDDLMEVSRITRGRLELERRAIPLEAALRNALETAEPLLRAGGHRIDLRLPGETLMLDADPMRIAQVFTNLLNNAARYTDDGGAVTVEAAREGATAVVTITDSGHGIDRAELPRLFEMFSRGDRVARYPQGGLGVGLALVRSIVELHGGTVSAHSDGPGKGSRFTVRLPLAGPGAADAPAPGTAAPAANPALRVLVVDDNIDAAESMALLLRQLGHEVAIAHDGPAALAACVALRPRVVLLDIGLPGMNGYAVARELRTRLDGARPMLVALTGWGQADDKARAREAGFDHHLVKPSDLDQLARILATAAARDAKAA